MTNLYSSRSILTPLDQPLYRDLHIIDGTALVVRAFFKDRYNYYFTPSGIEVGAILYFFDLLNTVISNACIPNVVIVFDDRGGSNYRRELYPEYKRNRPPIDNFLLEQMIMIRQLTESLGYSVTSSNLFEADDVIASLCHSNLAQYYYIESRDKDFAQLLKYNNILLLDSFKRKYYNCYTGFDKFGVDCKYAIDFQALCGDSIDNIPGVKGIASTTAQALINQFGSLEQIYAVAEAGKMTKISRFSPQNITKKLLENKENAFLSYNLASLVTDVDLALDSLQTCHQLDLDLDQFFKYTQAYELYSLRVSLKNKTLGYPYVGIDYNYTFGSYLQNVHRDNNPNSNFSSNSSKFERSSKGNFGVNTEVGSNSSFGFNSSVEDHSSFGLNTDIGNSSNFEFNSSVESSSSFDLNSSSNSELNSNSNIGLNTELENSSSFGLDINVENTNTNYSNLNSELSANLSSNMNLEQVSDLSNLSTTQEINPKTLSLEESNSQIANHDSADLSSSEIVNPEPVNSKLTNLDLSSNISNLNYDHNYVNHYENNYGNNYSNLVESASFDDSHYQSYMTDETMILDNDSYIPNYEHEQHVNSLDLYQNHVQEDLFSPDQWIKFKKKYPLLSKDSKVRPISRDNLWKLDQIMQERKFTGPIE